MVSTLSLTAPVLLPLRSTTWTYPRSNLLGPCSSDLLFSNSSDPIKLEILEHLVAMLQSDVVALQSKTEEDIEALSGLQEELVDRADIVTSILLEVESERISLKQRVLEMTEEADMMTQWLRVCDLKSIISATGNKIEETFEVEDMDSKKVLESTAGEEAIEDVVYALDKAIQVRIFVKEQFFYKANVGELKKLKYIPNIRFSMVT
ncbi:hypothetical protein MKX03_023855 [Papaver bracteatum]|nr:hypothetical protein MKX03_023855 [Papaver bracteatum]